MNMEDEALLRQKEVIRQIVDNPMFPAAMNMVRSAIGYDMLREDDDAKRNQLFIESRALDRIAGRMVAIANEVRKYEHLASDEKARLDALAMRGN